MRVLLTVAALLISVTAYAESEEYILNIKEDYKARISNKVARRIARRRGAKRPATWLRAINGTKRLQRIKERGLKRSVARTGYRLKDPLPLENTYLVTRNRNRMRFPGVGSIGYVEPNTVVTLTLPELKRSFTRSGNPNCGEFINCANDPFENWGVGPVVGIDAFQAWRTSTGSSDIVVAVIGSGIDLDHPDLVANLWSDPSGNFTTGESVRGFNAFSNTLPEDDFGFSTHEAGIIGARGDNNIGAQGVNWQVQLMAVKVIRLVSGNTITTSLDALIRGLGYIIKKKQQGNNIRVVQSNWLAPGTSTALQQQISQLNSLGILFVSTAGDNSSDLDTQRFIPASYNLPNVLTVGSYFGSFTAQSSFIDYSPFSNFGDQTVHVAAPGEVIWSTWIGGGYQSWAGGGTAAAFASGTAALLASIDNTLTAGELKDLIVNNAKPFPEFNGLTITGGAVNAGNAVEAIAPEPVLNGDYNCDGTVDVSDYQLWRSTFGSQPEDSRCTADGNGDGRVDAADYTVWRDNLGATR